MEQPRSEGNADVLRMEWEIGRALELLKNPVSYGRTRSRIEKARWIKQPAAPVRLRREVADA